MSDSTEAERLTGTFVVDLLVSVKVTVNDERVIRRCTENHDDQGVPQPEERGGSGWRDMFYDERTRDDVLAHLAHNFMRGHDFAQLDGWADLPNDAASGYVMAIECETVWDE